MVQTPAILAVGALGQQFPLQREGVVPSTDSSVSFTTGVSNSSAYGSQTDNGEESNQPGQGHESYKRDRLWGTREHSLV